MIVIFILTGFLCGSLMFSYWLGLAVKKDLTKVGDGNPGAFNLCSAAGLRIGILGVFLDFMKGYVPIKLLLDTGYLEGPALTLTAMAPIFGHAFSPFMGFRGGKGIALTFGIWSAVTGFEVSIAYALILAALKLISKLIERGKPSSPESDAFQVVSGMLLLSIYLLFREFPGNILILWLSNFILLIFTNKTKLRGFLKMLSHHTAEAARSLFR